MSVTGILNTETMSRIMNVLLITEAVKYSFKRLFYCQTGQRPYYVTVLRNLGWDLESRKDY